MNKIAKYVFWAIMVLCLGTIIFINYQKDKEEYKIVDSIIDKVLNSDEPNVVYIAPSKCEECNLQTYQMKLLVEKYSLDYYYINLENLSASHIKKVFSRLGIEKNTKTSTIAVFKNNELDDYLVGIDSINRLFNMLKKYDILSSDKLPINYLNLSTYVEKIEENQMILAIGSYKDEYSIQVEELLWNIASEYNIDINFIHLINLTQIEGELFESKIVNFDDSEVVVPSLLLIENQSIVDLITGVAEEEEYVEFFRENGIIE